MAFIVFEGLDGSGKSTLLNQLKTYVENQGISVIQTHEPGGSVFGEKIRDILLSTSKDSIPVPRAELLLYQASRAQLVETTIKPALAKNQWVLCDRYTASSLAFQCGARGIDESLVSWLNSYATQNLEPDWYILLDLSIEDSEKRRGVRGRDLDRMEQEKADFHQNVRNTYLSIAKSQKNWITLDASLGKQELWEDLLKQLQVRKVLS
ncbi:MAG: dTMP kinase [Bdellovibrionaceae bacterium]|nr:dTMP kinase [Pseudobdellovibrionaceae bacterium]